MTRRWHVFGPLWLVAVLGCGKPDRTANNSDDGPRVADFSPGSNSSASPDTGNQKIGSVAARPAEAAATRKDEVAIAPVIEAASDRRRTRANPGVAAVALTSYFRNSRPVSAESGGQVKGDDGTVVAIEPHGISADSRLSIHALRPKQPTSEPITVYDIALDNGARLIRPATVTLPVGDPAKVRDQKDVHVFHFNEREFVWEPLAVRLAADKKAVTFETGHFSRFVQVEPSTWAAYRKQVLAERRAVRPLPVPYYWQYKSGWCWATSLAMIEGFQGSHRDVWQIPADPAFKKDFRTGAADADDLAAFLRRRHPDWQVETNWFQNSDSLAGYLMYQLDQGRPVWVGLPYAGHAVVVVGYNSEAVYVHDPSGLLLDFTLGKAAGDAAEATGHLAAVRIPWGRWHTVALNSSLSTVWHNVGTNSDIEWSGRSFNPLTYFFPNQTLAVTSPAPPGRCLSVQLVTAQHAGDQTAEDHESFAISHRHWPNPLEKAERHNAERLHFFWRGLEPPGYVFTYNVTEKSHGHEGQKLCNNDVVRALRPLLSNTADNLDKNNLVLSVYLDGELLASKKTDLGAWKVNQPVDLREFRRKSALVPGKTVPGFDLNEEPLVPGTHTLRFQVSDQSQVVDESTVGFEVAPGMVRGVNAEKLPDGSVRLTWEANREEGIPGTRMVYEVWRGTHDYGTGFATVRPGLHGFHDKTTTYHPENKIRYCYSVWARDLRSGLTSQDASLVWPVTARTPAPAESPAFELVGALAKGPADPKHRGLATWFACPNLTVKALEASSGARVRELTGICQGEVASQRGWHKVVVKSKLKSWGTTTGALSAQGDISLFLNGTVEIDYLDNNGKRQGTAIYRARLDLEGALRGNVASGTYQLRRGAPESRKGQVLIPEEEGWTGCWKAEVRGIGTKGS